MAKCSLGGEGGITGDESSSKVGDGTKPAGTDSTEESRQRGTAETAMHTCDERSIRNVADGKRAGWRGMACDEGREGERMMRSASVRN